MNKIETLTPEQEALIPIYVEKWRKIGLCTDPANRPLAEDGIRLAYKNAGLKPPKEIIWYESPSEIMLFYVLYLRRILRNKWLITMYSIVQAILKGRRRAFSQRLGRRQQSPWAPPMRLYGWRDSILYHLSEKTLSQVVFPMSLQPAIWNDKKDTVAKFIWNNMDLSVRGNFGRSALDYVWDNIPFRVKNNLVLLHLWDRVMRSYSISIYGGSISIRDYCFYDYVSQVCGIKEAIHLHGWFQVAENAGYWQPCRDVCFICERPNIIELDKQDRLHCMDGPALQYPNGWSIYAWHGVRVPEAFVLRPDTITVEQIEQEDNAEVQRVMIERYGEEQFLQDSGAEEIARDTYGILYRKEILDDEPLVMVKVKNATPESDGSYKNYFIRVPPNMQTAHEAVAWTFGMRPEDYHLTFES